MEKKAEVALPVNDNERMIRIVAADDNVKVLKMLQKNFSKIGVQIQTCMKKKELQECLKKEEADVLFIDESMDDVSGIDFCMLIQGQYPDLKKILMISQVTREIAEAKSRNIIDGYVEKPVSATTLLEAVRDVQIT